MLGRVHDFRQLARRFGDPFWVAGGDRVEIFLLVFRFEEAWEKVPGYNFGLDE